MHILRTQVVLKGKNTQVDIKDIKLVVTVLIQQPIETGFDRTRIGIVPSRLSALYPKCNGLI